MPEDLTGETEILVKRIQKPEWWPKIVVPMLPNIMPGMSQAAAMFAPMLTDLIEERDQQILRVMKQNNII